MSARSLELSPEPENKKKIGNARALSLDDKEVNRFRSIISAPIKGLIKGGIDTAKLMPQLLAFAHPGAYLLQGRKSALPPSFQEPYEKGLEKAEEFTEENLPTRPEKLEGALERTGKLAGPAVLGAATGGGSLLGALGTSALGGIAGQATEELGGGPFLQSLAEVGSFAAPSLARKIIPSSAEQTKILEMGRKFGMSEKALAPLMPETAKKKFFGKFAHTGESTQDILKESRRGVQNIYNSLETSEAAKKFLPEKAMHKFAVDMEALGKKMPFNVRSQLKNDAMDLVRSAAEKGGLEGSELMNFYHDISSRYNIGKSQLELFKNPIRDALGHIDPQLAKDFETVNKMYQKSIQIGRILKPSQYEDLISLGEAYELGSSIATLDPGRLRKMLGFLGFRKFSEKMLTDPRLQNLIKKTQIAIQKNNLPLLKQLGEQALKEFKEED